MGPLGGRLPALSGDTAQDKGLRGFSTRSSFAPRGESHRCRRAQSLVINLKLIFLLRRC